MPNGATTTIQRRDHLARRALRKFLRDPGEAWLLCRMAWWVSVLSVAARCCSLPRALALVAGASNASRSSSGTVTNDDVSVPERLAGAIDLLLSADVAVFKPICWKRAAVLHRYLSHHGITTRIVFGVRNDPDGKVAGHAWLEAEGQPILESTPPEYVVTYRFPSNESSAPQLATFSLE